MKSKLFYFSVLTIIGSIIVLVIYYKKPVEPFNGTRAWESASYQVSLGPRIPGSKAHERVRSWIATNLKDSAWDVELQSCLDCTSLPIHNIIAKRGVSTPWIIIGAHYDSRLYADRDPIQENQSKPVPGANDGASGIGVLLELARILPKNLNNQIWLVFFDVEDNGRISTHDWSMGSRHFVNILTKNANQLPDNVVIIDMIGDRNLEIYYEKNSNQPLMDEIWSIANELGYDQFIAQPKHRMIDDHLPFIEAGIPAIDIIDFDYPYWHTISDTSDKISPESLQAVGSTLYAWLTKIP